MTLSHLLLPLILSLSPNDRVSLELFNGDTIEGRLTSVQPGVLFIYSPQGDLEIDLELISSAFINDVQLEADALELETEALWQTTRSRLAPVGSLPNPYWAATASALLPGSGQRMLGQDRTANSYLFADVALLSLSGWLIFGAKDYRNAVPLVSLDLVFRLYSAIEAFRDTKMRRALISGQSHIGR